MRQPRRGPAREGEDMKLHKPFQDIAKNGGYLSHTCQNCGATRELWVKGDYPGPWRLAGKPQPYCVGASQPNIKRSSRYGLPLPW